MNKAHETINLDQKNATNKEKTKLYVQFFRPHKGPSNVGFQVYVQLDPEQEPPVYFRFDKQIIKARLERNGLFSCWSPEHEIGDVTLDVSVDQLHWVNAGILTYERDYTLISRLLIVGSFIIVYFLGIEIRKCYLRRNKTRRSDTGQEDPLIPKTKNLI